QVGYYEDHPYNSYFSGNVVQICPVGALTSASYRFQSRPFDLVSVTTTCEHCAGGCQLRVDSRHNVVRRRLAGDDPAVNEEWNCDKGRFAFVSGRGDDRITTPMVRRGAKLEPASWPEAIDIAVNGLKAAGSSVGVLTGGRLTLEAAYGYSKFARTVLGTNNIDFRSRPASDEEAAFLGAHVAGVRFEDAISYADLEQAKHVVLVAFEPEDEAGITFLRLRKAVRKFGLKVTTLAPFTSRGSEKLNAEVISCPPGGEAEILASMQLSDDAIVLVGERAGVLPGLLSTVAAKGVRFAWIPRRAGDMGAIEAGCLPNLLPGGRPAADASARVDLATHWDVEAIPSATGRSATEQFRAAIADEQKAFVTAGIEAHDFADPNLVLTALETADFVVSIERRENAITDIADVVFPVALLEESTGSFLNWEHRLRQVNRATKADRSPMTELR
ncbi:MAG: NADH-quinone oxidoreductase subunit G, partial [Propionibacterium sp.]